MKIYNITFKDGETLRVSDEQGTIIKENWLAGKKAMPIDIDDFGFLIGDIKRIEAGYESEAVPVEKTLPTGRRCRGQYSLHKELMRVIKLKYGSEWLKYLSDDSVRNDVKKQLLARTDHWCFNGKCVCDENYIPDANEIHSIIDIFPGAQNVPITNNRKDLE